MNCKAKRGKVVHIPSWTNTECRTFCGALVEWGWEDVKDEATCKTCISASKKATPEFPAVELAKIAARIAHTQIVRDDDMPKLEFLSRLIRGEKVTKVTVELELTNLTHDGAFSLEADISDTVEMAVEDACWTTDNVSWKITIEEEEG